MSLLSTTSLRPSRPSGAARAEAPHRAKLPAKGMPLAKLPFRSAQPAPRESEEVARDGSKRGEMASLGGQRSSEGRYPKCGLQNHLNQPRKLCFSFVVLAADSRGTVSKTRFESQFRSPLSSPHSSSVAALPNPPRATPAKRAEDSKPALALRAAFPAQPSPPSDQPDSEGFIPEILLT